MNVSDTEVVTSILHTAGYTTSPDAATADVVLLNTCAIREKAEERVWGRLAELRGRLRPTTSTTSIICTSTRTSTTERRSPDGSTYQPSSSGRPIVGLLGCMAERLKERVLDQERLVDLVVGPDAYRDLPRLLDVLRGGEGKPLTPSTSSVGTHTGSTSTDTSHSTSTSIIHDHDHAHDKRSNYNTRGDTRLINVQLSLEETYADVAPVRADPSRVDAFVSITRGCNNMCAFCVVPFTRGRERSRPLDSILDEVRRLVDQGVREVTLLGQNVNSYAYPRTKVDTYSLPYRREDVSRSRMRGETALQASTDPTRTLMPMPTLTPTPPQQPTMDDDAFVKHYATGFKSVYRPSREGCVTFVDLLDRVAEIDTDLRVRYTSPHPKDFCDDVLEVIASRANVTSWVHMPAQSGSSDMLERMKRGYVAPIPPGGWIDR